jgi:hypothetical protein
VNDALHSTTAKYGLQEVLSEGFRFTEVEEKGYVDRNYLIYKASTIQRIFAAISIFGVTLMPIASLTHVERQKSQFRL